MPAPTMLLTKLLQAPAMPDFFLGRDKFEICRLVVAMVAAPGVLLPSTSRVLTPIVSLTASKQEGSATAGSAGIV